MVIFHTPPRPATGPSLERPAATSLPVVGQVIGAGALQCFLKPFQVDRLMEGVRQALDTEAA